MKQPCTFIIFFDVKHHVHQLVSPIFPHFDLELFDVAILKLILISFLDGVIEVEAIFLSIAFRLLSLVYANFFFVEKEWIARTLTGLLANGLHCFFVNLV